MFEVAAKLIRYSSFLALIRMLSHGGSIICLIFPYVCMGAFTYELCYVLIHSGCMYVFLLNQCSTFPCHVGDLL